jgi:NAD(P)-dependent dehydrogenase (short-subunit alcohol dehydrogenase family)
LLAEEASNHIILCSRSLSKGETAMKILQSKNLPGSSELLQLDVGNEDSIAAAVQEVEGKHGR